MDGKPCLRCNVEISVDYNKYCSRCLRIIAGRTPEPKFKRDPNNKLCSKCKNKPRTKGKNYCQDCQNIYQAERIKKLGGRWKSLSAEQKRKDVVRRYVSARIQRGKFIKTPCEICGKKLTEIHHWDYERMTLNVSCLCHDHHTQADNLQKQGLTKVEILTYLSVHWQSSASGTKTDANLQSESL